ncbi:MAG: hypothetical protein IK999_09950, partial [Ruminococcus sp.]|nr:hypothetical protein [Ruminococcus sp.]
MKLQKRSVTISGYGCLIRKLSLRSIHTKMKMNDIYRWLKNMGEMISVYFDILNNFEKAYTPEILSTFLMSDIFR